MRAIKRTTPITIPATAPFESPAENETKQPNVTKDREGVSKVTCII